MRNARIVRFYLHKTLKERAETGNHNFINKFCAVLEREGFKVKFHNDGLEEQMKSRVRPGYSVFLMSEPTDSRGVSMRLNYFYPFWNIEQSGKRWEWPVAKARFDAGEVPVEEAQRFARFWRKRLFEGAAEETTREGLVYVPLQGRLLTHRSFQACSPIRMIEHVLEQDREREVVATLHPKEIYGDEEIAALEALEARHDRLTVSREGMVPLLQRCDYVVTQNSAVALSGYFFHKPAVLFGRINFHHIAANVHELGVAGAMAEVVGLAPQYDAYLWWFLQHMSINAGHDEAEGKIRDALVRAGWLEG